MDSMSKYYITEITAVPANRNRLPRRLIFKKVAIIGGMTIAIFLIGWLVSR
ncbi:MAG: hypothetical protein LBQ43_03370 [Holosporales bacterium]|jgi:hypothetical protein|nr:hypothetical protein [Holosporales bacterium]